MRMHGRHTHHGVPGGGQYNVPHGSYTRPLDRPRTHRGSFSRSSAPPMRYSGTRHGAGAEADYYQGAQLSPSSRSMQYRNR